MPATDDLQVAKAQLGLDNDELADAQRDLERASGDESARHSRRVGRARAIDAEVRHPGREWQLAVISVAQNRTLASRVKAWLGQRQRYDLIQQAQQQALADARYADGAAQCSGEPKQNSVAAGTASFADRAAQLASLHDRSTEREILGIDDDRIQTEQQLASVYAKWAAQVQVQHVIVLHLILSSLMLILLILVAMLLGDAAVRRLMAQPALDRRQMRTLAQYS